ncbi:DUF6389 family protein [Micromonospora sp. HUAS LYJ1]|uniref:DUF6389 family protein n=1 Tax=Micromonospora sp. HUAS LYJ1 TaxID=3061626 RepID=UPI00267170CA|nr:DUF6389 family protein [Micromonospora sp. HUAS LYJ1]WKU02982.1 DUF6389 family protein [Micromonospora sp. HUAS LYJ1]
MEARGYADELGPILATCTAEVASRLARFRSAAEEAGGGVEGILVDVFVDQDGEGPFDVWARFCGDAAFTLNQRFDGERHLFGVEWGEEGWEPDVPGRPRGWTRDDLERAVLAVVTEWISPVVPQGPPGVFWRISTPDGVTA